MQTLNAVYAWYQAHYALVWSVAYVLLNVIPRPHGTGLIGWRLALWGSLDRLCLLSADRVGGSFKALFAATKVAP